MEQLKKEYKDKDNEPVFELTEPIDLGKMVSLTDLR